MKTFNLYTDGACQPNPGKGGWSYILEDENGVQDVCSGYEPNTTNNRMEMTAVLIGIQDFLKLADNPRAPGVDKEDVLCINSDSKYLLDGIETWCETWAKNDWTKKGGKELLNKDLWKLLYHLKDKVNLEFKFIKGHTGDPHNEECDRLAVEAIKRKSGTRFESTKSEMATPEEPPDWHDKFLRAKADLENVIKRKNKDADDRVNSAVSNVLSSFFNIIDDFDGALAAWQPEDDGLAKFTKKGFEMIYEKMEHALGMHGATRIKVKEGQEFDPSTMNAVSSQSGTEFDENSVVMELSPGYKSGTRILRPAYVVVAKDDTDN